MNRDLRIKKARRLLNEWADGLERHAVPEHRVGDRVVGYDADALEYNRAMGMQITVLRLMAHTEPIGWEFITALKTFIKEFEANNKGGMKVPETYKWAEINMRLWHIRIMREKGIPEPDEPIRDRFAHDWESTYGSSPIQEVAKGPGIDFPTGA